MFGGFQFGRLLYGGWTVVVRFARPISDIISVNWSIAPLYEKINEEIRSDLDFVKSNSQPSDSYFEVQLSLIGDPDIGVGHKVKYVIAKDISEGGVGIINMIIELRQGSTVIASWTHNNLFPTPILIDQELTTAQADAITDYGDLRLRFTANMV